MAIRNIVIQGEPVLHRRATEVAPDFLRTPEFQRLISDMIETMYAAKGVGIAAPQIGVGQRLFIAESPDGPMALVNPVFTSKSRQRYQDEEGCLSVPGEFLPIYRHRSVEVEALTVDGKPVAFKASGFFARVLQHEMDHLDGILIVDRSREAKK